MEETAVQSDFLSFKNIINSYVNYITQQYIATPLIMEKLDDIYKKQGDNYNNFISENNLEASTNSDETSSQELSITQEKIEEYEQHYKDIKAIYFIKNSILETQFIDCITRFDSFLLNLIKKIYLLKPEILSGSEKTISYKLLLTMDSIDNARNALISDILDELFRGSHISQLEYLRKTFKLDVKKEIENTYKNFVEVTERRNILIHCEGKVSKQYLNVCNENGISANVTESIKLEIDEDYFIRSCDTLLEMSLKIGYSIWKKQAKTEKDIADDYLLQVCNNLILDKKYDLATSIIDYALNFEIKPNNLYTHHFKIYKLSILKIQGKTVELNKGLTEDWSSVKNSIALALHVLNNSFDKAISLMKKMGNDEQEIDSTLYYNSVVFKDLIEKVEFKEAYREIYDRDFTYKRTILNL